MGGAGVKGGAGWTGVRLLPPPVGAAGRGRGAGRGLGDSDSPRTLQQLPLSPPAPLRSHRFLSRDLGLAAMSATEEVDGLGVSRPHYGCECGASRRGGFGAGLSASEAPLSRGACRGG